MLAFITPRKILVFHRLAISFLFRRNSKIFEKSSRNCQSFPTKFSTKYQRWIAIRPEHVSSTSQFFLPSFGGSNYFSFSAFPYIRSTKPSNWIPTVTYNRGSAISPPGIFILSYYLISPVTRINVSAQDPLIAAIPHTLPSSHQSVAIEISHNFATTLTEIHISFHSSFLSRIVLFFLYTQMLRDN